MRYLANAFSLNMLAVNSGSLRFNEVSTEHASNYIKQQEYVSAVGHADTAKVFGSELRCDVATNRLTLKIGQGDTVLVGQYSGPRLEEGATTLPIGASIKWFLVWLE